MVRKYKIGQAKKLDEIRNRTTRVLNDLDAVFEDKDPLLRAQAVVPVYYLTMRNAADVGKQSRFRRERIAEFQESLTCNRDQAAKDITKANFDLLEYDRMTQQGTNDAASIRERVRILCEILKIPEPEKEK